MTPIPHPPAPSAAGAIAFPATRWSLVGRAPTGDVGTLVELYADCIGRYLRLRFPEVGGADLDDLVQDVLIHLLERPDLLAAARPREGGRFRYFLATVAFNHARNVLRARRRAAHHLRPLPDGDGDDHGAATTAMETAWETSVLAAAWADLRGWAAAGLIAAEAPDLLQAHLAGEAIRGLAQRSGQSPATCQRRIAQARTWLRHAIEQRQRGDPVDPPA